jgi:hypothetical protein
VISVSSDDVRLQFQRDEAIRESNNETNRWWNNFYFWQSKQVDRDTERAVERSREAHGLAWPDRTSLPDPGVGVQQPDGLSEIRDYEPPSDDGPRNLDAPPPRPGLSGEPGTRDPVPDAAARPDAGVPGRPPPDPPPTLSLSAPGVPADPVLRGLLPPDPDTASRLLSDLKLIGDRMDAAAALSAAGNVAQAQAAERAAREVYDFWSGFYRNQERIALIAERLHELAVETVERAEDARRAGGMWTAVDSAPTPADGRMPERPAAATLSGGALTDPVLQGLLPPDPDTATRLLSDLTLIGDRMDAAAALRATGNVAQAQAEEYAARQVYDFWSAFYRNQERLALIAERLHELTVASIEGAEADRVAGQWAAQTLDGVVELPPKTYSEMTGASEEPNPYRPGYLNGVFMKEALAEIKDKEHPLHGLLYDSKKEDWTSRADDADEPTVQAGHLVSRHAGLREYFALEDSSLNQLSGQKGETQGAIFVKTAIDIGGIPVERRTAELWEKQGKLPAGTVDNAQAHSGWTRIRKPRKTPKATT